MSGFITKTEVKANEQYIIETWGAEFFAACMESEGSTFLSVLVAHGKL